mmetsp:Transcript_2127/g.7391  ORF Transcript_2127/g.7391 Transcript_2127/m.7391 type:complete len:389 (+) Transcript_2127:721-1887(+)
MPMKPLSMRNRHSCACSARGSASRHALFSRCTAWRHASAWVSTCSGKSVHSVARRVSAAVRISSGPPSAHVRASWISAAGVDSSASALRLPVSSASAGRRTLRVCRNSTGSAVDRLRCSRKRSCMLRLQKAATTRATASGPTDPPPGALRRATTCDRGPDGETNHSCAAGAAPVCARPLPTDASASTATPATSSLREPSPSATSLRRLCRVPGWLPAAISATRAPLAASSWSQARGRSNSPGGSPRDSHERSGASSVTSMSRAWSSSQPKCLPSSSVSTSRREGPPRGAGAGAARRCCEGGAAPAAGIGGSRASGAGAGSPSTLRGLPPAPSAGAPEGAGGAAGPRRSWKLASSAPTTSVSPATMSAFVSGSRGMLNAESIGVSRFQL